MQPWSAVSSALRHPDASPQNPLCLPFLADATRGGFVPVETMPPTPPIPTKVTRRILPATLSRRLRPLLLSSPACLLRRRPRRLLGGRSGDDHQGGGREASPARRGLRACPIPVSLALLTSQRSYSATLDERKGGRRDALRLRPEAYPRPLRTGVDVLVTFRDSTESPRASCGTWTLPCT